MSKMTDLMQTEGAKQFLSGIERKGGKKDGGTKKAYTIALGYFQDFLEPKGHGLRSIIKPILTNEINVYELLDEFVTFLLEKNAALSAKTIRAYMAGVRSFLDYNDIEIVPRKFKRKVNMPPIFVEDEEPIDVEDIREILLHCSNRRLKTYLLILGSSGPRTIEDASLGVGDLDLDHNKINIRKEFTKTKRARYSFISDETVKFIREWIAWKYRTRRAAKQDKITPIKNDEDLLFSSSTETAPLYIYQRLRIEFAKVLSQINKSAKKDGSPRRKITLNSFRRFAKSVASDQVSSDFSEWLIGQAKSSYYTKKQEEKWQIYKTKCMKYLTFLDYTTLESAGKNIESKLSEKDKEIQLLRQRDQMKDEALTQLSDRLDEVMEKVQRLEGKK